MAKYHININKGPEALDPDFRAWFSNMMKMGRQNPDHKLTPEQINELRKELRASYPEKVR